MQDVYQRWGIANSLHVIAMAHTLIGMPKSMPLIKMAHFPGIQLEKDLLVQA
jgi:hypothetical protein